VGYTSVSRFGWLVGEMLCHEQPQQLSSHLNETCYT